MITSECNGSVNQTVFRFGGGVRDNGNRRAWDKAVVGGKAANLLGVCGEHDRDPRSIAFFETVGFDYVSASPFPVPIARLALRRRRWAVHNCFGDTAGSSALRRYGLPRNLHGTGRLSVRSIDFAVAAKDNVA